MRLTSIKNEHYASNIALSVIVPYFNEEKVLPALHSRLTHVLDSLSEQCEIIYVDDGSSDESLQIVEKLHASRSLVRSISLSRNFGKEPAMSAGLKYDRFFNSIS